MRTMLTRKIYPQNASRASSTKGYIGDNRSQQQRYTSKAEKEPSSHDKHQDGSKWDKTDSECKFHAFSSSNFQFKHVKLRIVFAATDSSNFWFADIVLEI